MPFVRHIYNASKQISAAISPDQNKHAFKEVVIIRHPRIGEYAFGFITSEVLLQVCLVSLLDSVMGLYVILSWLFFVYLFVQPHFSGNIINILFENDATEIYGAVSFIIY